MFQNKLNSNINLVWWWIFGHRVCNSSHDASMLWINIVAVTDMHKPKP